MVMVITLVHGMTPILIVMESQDVLVEVYKPQQRTLMM